MQELINKQVDAGPVSDFPVKMSKEVVVGSLKLAVFRLEEEEFYTIKNECPHKKGPLVEGIISGEHVFCPLHNWKISVKDGQAAAPDEGCVETYSTEIKNGHVFITV